MNRFAFPTFILIILVGIFSLNLIPKQKPYERAKAQTVLLRDGDKGSGSGFVVRRYTLDTHEPRLFVWTAKHVAEGAGELSAEQFYHSGGRKLGKQTFRARKIYEFPDIDVALLVLDAPDDKVGHGNFADSLPVVPGTPVFQTGNFYGDRFDNTLTFGRMAQTGVRPKDEDFPWRITDQADINVAPGCSGGPVFNMAGEVIGLVGGGPTRGLEGVCLFIPVREIVQQATEKDFMWAVNGSWCPSDKTIDSLAKLQQPKKEAEPLVLVIPLLPEKSNPDKKPNRKPVKH